MPAETHTVNVNGHPVRVATNVEIRPGYSPYVGENGHWYEYDTSVKAFVDTGVLASGNGITSIAKTGTSGLVDTYTITFVDGTTTTFTVTNGNGISSIEKTGTSGNVDTYTITFTNGTTMTYTVTNANVTTSGNKIIIA